MSWDIFFVSMSAHHAPINAAAKKAGIDRGAAERDLRTGKTGKNRRPLASKAASATPRRGSIRGARQ